MVRVDMKKANFQLDAANENEQLSLFEHEVYREHKSFAPAVPRKEFGLRRTPPSVLKSWPGICH